MPGTSRLLARGAAASVKLKESPAATKAKIEATPAREAAGSYAGPATVETSAVVYNREGEPAVGVLAALTPDGRRALANTVDASVLASMVTEEWAGRAVELATDGTVNRLAV